MILPGAGRTHQPECPFCTAILLCGAGSRLSARDCGRDRSLKSFAHMATVSPVGCSFCLDLGYFQARNENLDLAEAREVPRWPESDLFTPLERDVMEYAEAMTHTPPTVTDEFSARLLEALGAPPTAAASAVQVQTSSSMPAGRPSEPTMNGSLRRLDARCSTPAAPTQHRQCTNHIDLWLGA
ncbi:MAG TPA: hypothetical protein VIW24_12220 [Aldersonia sp.]